LSYEPEMKEIEIKHVSRVDAAVKIPGSKSYTQRALAIAALAEGTSFLSNALLSGDTERLMSALRDLGAEIMVGDDGITVNGTGGDILNPGREIHLGNNGTALRLLISLVALGRGNYVLTGDGRLRERPVKPLLDALVSMGICVRSDGGFPPVIIDAEGMPGGTVALRDIESSQYVSSLLISAPYAAKATIVELRGRTPSQPYIDMTLETMEAFGVPVVRQAPDRYLIKAGRRYRGKSYRVEGDASSASYFFTAAAVSGGRIRVEEINPRTLQGDIAFLGILEQLGCAVVRGNSFVEVEGGKLRSGDFVFDLGDMPDMVPTLAVIGAVRPGKTVVKNVSHLRFKESNRLEALVTELNRVGIRAYETEDGLVIEGGSPRSAAIETYNDHRIAMSFAVLGLVVPGIRIKDGDCVKKSFPGFWAELSKLTS